MCIEVNSFLFFLPPCVVVCIAWCVDEAGVRVQCEGLL